MDQQKTQNNIPNMAKQAMDVIDTHGQDAMLLFVTENSAASNEPPAPEPRVAVMKDGTIIQEYSGHYCFSWTDDQNKVRSQSRRKPDPEPERQEANRPTPFRDLAPTVPYHDFAVYEKVMETVFYQAAARAGLHYSFHQGVPESISSQPLAHELSAAIQQALIKEEISDHAWYTMDREAEHCAEVVVQSLLPETMEGLTKYAEALIKEENNTQLAEQEK